MEVPFALSDLFAQEVTVIGPDLIPQGCPKLQQLGAKEVRSRVSILLDTIGKKSADAQALHSVITNAERLQKSENKLYLFCDLGANLAVGLLKIGRKKLFLFDSTGIQHELSPICILDFYIHESRQRQGAGKYLFQWMLAEEGIPPEHFAIDRPSDKFVFFLKRHYGLNRVLPQVNNFVLFDGFFENRSDYVGKKARWNGVDQQPDTPDRIPLHKVKQSRLEDSLQYNTEPLIHLRNGHQLPPNYTQKRHISSMGDIFHPNAQNADDYERNGNGPHFHSNGGGPLFLRSVTDVLDFNELEYDHLRHQPRRISRLQSLSPEDVEIHYDLAVNKLNSAQNFQKLRARSRSREVDQGHAHLW